VFSAASAALPVTDLSRSAGDGPTGCVGFAAPFAGARAFAWFALHWHWQAAQIAGVALSTTSVAVVYAVMVETGLDRTDLGKLILTACFVCDLGTVLALGILFASYNLLLIAFGIATAVVLLLLPRTLRLVLRTLGHPVSEPEVKFVLLLLLQQRRGEVAAAGRRLGASVPERGRLPGRRPAGTLRSPRVPAPAAQAAALDEPAGAVAGGGQAADQGDRPVPRRDELPEPVLQ